MIRLIVRPAAEADILDAQTWYSKHASSLADEFVDELRATLRRVREMPRQFPEVEEAPDVRCFIVFCIRSTFSSLTTSRRSSSRFSTRADRPRPGRGVSRSTARADRVF